MKTTILLILFNLCWFAAVHAQNVPENIVLKNLNGEETSFKEFVKDGPVIVSFWATWCKPCQSELEALKERKDDWQNKIRIVAVTIDDARATAKVKSIVKGKKWPFEILFDTNKELYKALNISAVPYVMIVNKGKIVWTHSGYMPGNEITVLEKALELTEDKK